MPATRFVIRNYLRDGLSLSFELVAVNADGTVDTAFAGSAAFSANNSVTPGLPASYAFTAADQGVHRFSTTIQTIENVQIFASGTGLDMAGIYIGGNGPDSFTGGAGGDVFDPGGGTNNPLTGNAGEDIFYLRGGINTLAGGDGVDRLIFDLRGNGAALRNQPGVPIQADPAGGLQGAFTNDQNASVNFTGIENITILTDNNSGDNITTGSGEDEYSQVALDSPFYIRDVVNLGGGIDRLAVDARNTNGALSFIALNYDGSGEAALYGNGKLGFTNVERFFWQGGNAGDDLRGLDFADRFDGNNGNDRLAGRGGNDDLRGGAGADVIDGDGRATILLAADNPTAVGDFRVTGVFNLANPAVFDIAVGTASVGTARLRIRATDVENASAGFDPEVDEVYVNDVLVGTLAQYADNVTGDTILTFDATLLAGGVARVRIQNVNASQDYSFRIDDVELTLEKTGDDRLDGGAGVDQLVGGRGNDTYLVDEDRDQAQEAAGGGTDTVLSSAATYILGANVENLGTALPATATALTGETFVSASGAGAGQFPTSITPLVDGGYVIAWFDQNNGGDARVRVFNADGSARSGELQVTDGTAGNQGQFGLSAVQLGNGNILVATYATGGTGGEQILGRLFDANGVVQGGEFTLGDTGGFDSFPTMQRLGDGRIALVWQNNADGSGFGLSYRVLNADGSVGAAPVTFNSTTAGDQLEPVMAKLDDGRMVVAWESREPGGDVIRARVVNADGTLGGDDFTVSTLGGDLFRTAITAVNGGGFTVSWEGGGTVQARVFGSDLLPLGAQFRVNATAQPTEISSVTRLAEGGFMATWASFGGVDGSGLAILGRLFDADGTPRGGDFVVNQVTDSFQNSPRLATLADGRVVISFGSEAFQGGNYDVKAIILDTTPNQTLIGNELNNIVTGGFANDILSGSGGADTLTGNQGADLIYGGDVTGFGPNFVVNGSFETQDGVNSTRDFILAAPFGTEQGIAYRDTATLFGWQRGTGFPIELNTNNGSTTYRPANGTADVQLEWGFNQPQILFQDIAGLTGGQRYLLSFAANQLTRPENFTATMQVVWNGAVIATVSPETKTPGFYLFTLEAAATGIGAGGANRLEFREISSGDAGGTTLDAVSLQTLVAVPEFGGSGIGPNLIVNGSFEQRDATTSSRDYALANALTNYNGGDPIYSLTGELLGWGLLPGNTRVEFNTDNPNDTRMEFRTGDGLVGLDLEVFPGEQTGIFQDVTGLAAGARYRITASVAVPIGPGSGTVAVQVIWNGRVVGTVTPTSTTPTDFSFDVFAQANGAGTGGANRVAFQEIGGNDGQGRGVLLDNVRLNLVTGSDPAATDTVDYGAESGSGAVTVNLASGTATDSFGTIDRLFGIENAIGTARDDTIIGNSGANILSGGGGNDTIDGGAGIDELNGGAGNDRLTGGADTANSFIGGTGDDVFVVGNAGDSFVELSGQGTDIVETALAAYTLSAADIENLIGTAGTSQSLTGNALDNRITGTVGNDLLDGGAGADTLIGGAGSDTYRIAEAGDVIVEAANEGTDTVETALAAYTLTTSVENLVGTATTGQSLTGNALGNRIEGGGGNDVLDGDSGIDSLLGGAGNDRLIGGADTANELIGGTGDDIYVEPGAGDTIVELADGGSDTIETALASYTLATANVENLTGTASTGQSLIGTAGDNRITGGAGNDAILGEMGADALIGGGGNDTARYDDQFGAVFINLSLGQGFGNAAQGDTYVGIENATGSTFDDTLIGDPGTNILDGGSGNDVLLGGAGADTLIGGAGADTASYEGTSAAVFVNLLSGTGFSNTAQGDVLTGIENLTGGYNGDYLIGDSGANTLDGGTGDDVLIGGLGGDTLIGGGGSDTASYEDNQGAVTVDLLANIGTGSAAQGDSYSGIENVTGTAFRDTLVGDDAANILDGMGGIDTLTGNGGTDVFRIGSGPDTITDFVSGTDRIALDGALFARTATVDFVSGAGAQSASSANSAFLYDTTTGTLSYDADGTGAGASVVIASLGTGALLAQPDLLFY